MGRRSTGFACYAANPAWRSLPFPIWALVRTRRRMGRRERKVGDYSTGGCSIIHSMASLRTFLKRYRSLRPKLSDSFQESPSL